MERRMRFLHPLMSHETESLTYQPGMQPVLTVELKSPGMNTTSIDFCGPWQPYNDMNSSGQANFDFDTVNQAPLGRDDSAPGHPRPLLQSGNSNITIGGLDRDEGVQVQASRPLVETSISDIIGIHIP